MEDLSRDRNYKIKINVRELLRETFDRIHYLDNRIQSLALKRKKKANNLRVNNRSIFISCTRNIVRRE